MWVASLIAIVFAGDRVLAMLLDRALLRSQFRFSRVYRGGNDAAIVIMGDSRGVHSFYGPAIEHLTGQPVLNLSYNSMSSRIAEALLADYVDRNPPPRIVLIEITHLIMASDLETELRTYANHSARLRALYAETHPRAARLGRVFRLLGYNSEFFFRAMVYLRRSDQDWINHATITPELLATPASDWQLAIRPESLDALERTVRMLRGRGITVRLLIAPYESPGRITNVPEVMRTVTERVHLPVLNYVDAGGPVENFADRVHMNQRGAEKFMQRLAADGVFRASYGERVSCPQSAGVSPGDREIAPQRDDHTARPRGDRAGGPITCGETPALQLRGAAEHAALQRPAIRLGEPLAQRMFWRPTQRVDLRAVEQLAGRAVRLRRIEHDRAGIAGDIAHRLRERADRHFLAASDVDRVGLLVHVHQDEERVCEIVDVEKLAARRSGSPDPNLARARHLRLVKAPHHPRNHM